MADDYFKKVDPELTAKIDEAFKKKNIEMADSFEIEGYPEESARLLKDIFDIDLVDCFISDQSTLSDFAGCGDHGLNTQQVFQTKPTDPWMDWARNKIFLRFGVQVIANPTLLSLCEQIRNTKHIGAGLN